MPRTTFMMFALIVMVSMLSGGATATEDADGHASQTVDGHTTQTSDASEQKKPGAVQSRREGDTLEAVGRFEMTGDRVTFYPEEKEGDESFRVVENLALERVARVLEDPSGFGKSRQWSIAARILEYRGTHYLLLERVVLKGRKLSASSNSAAHPAATSE